MRSAIETYIGLWIILVAGIGASFVIIRAVNSNAAIITPTGSALNYLPF